MKRSRGRNNRRSGGNNNNNNHSNPNRHYESVGPDVKIRGSAQQVLDKYLQYARDAATSGDRVTSEAYYQFAEHYQRIVAKQNDAKEKQRLEREAREEKRREERATRQDERGDRGDRGNDRNQDADAEASKDDGSRDGGAKDGDTERKPRRNSRKRDEAKVETTSEASDTPDVSEETGPDEKPKRGRRTYKPRAKDAEAAPDTGDATDGVMKTLSRGRKKPAAADAVAETPEAAD